MNISANYQDIWECVQKELTCSAHNLDHVYRVYNLCLTMAKYEENVDYDVLIPAALLHDIARVKESEDKTGSIDHALLGSEIAECILKNFNYEILRIEKIKHCIISHRFRTDHRPKTIEAKILFDSDKLDAIGAIGIARTFMLAGQFGQRLIVNEQIEDYLEINAVENGRVKDMAQHSPLIEYEIKLKKIPQKLFTKQAIEIGVKRLKYMEEYFKRLQLEIEGIENI